MLEFDQPAPRRIAIVGVGLIGGSVALALHEAWPGTHIVGIDRDAANLAAALARGAIHQAGDVQAVAGAEMVLLAVPVRQIADVLRAIAPHLDDAAVVTDAGSTKQDVVVAARAALGARAANFVPGHPIAGREQAGVAAAVRDLFRDRNVVLTPLAENSAVVVARVRALWMACGARVVEMAAEVHDAVFAAVSHLPHMLAFALVDELAQRPNAKTLFGFAASGFRDFTRIAGSSPEMWRDIALNNRGALVAELDRYLAHAARLREAIAAGDAAVLEGLMSRAREAREKWLAGELDHFRDETA